jgi:hypothetical protein
MVTGGASQRGKTRAVFIVAGSRTGSWYVEAMEEKATWRKELPAANTLEPVKSQTQG